MKLSGRDSNTSRPSMPLPATLFPDPDRPSSTRRSSKEDGEDEGNEEGEEAKVSEEVEEE